MGKNDKNFDKLTIIVLFIFSFLLSACFVDCKAKPPESSNYTGGVYGENQHAS